MHLVLGSLYMWYNAFYLKFYLRGTFCVYVVSYFRIKNNTTTLTSSIGILFSYSFTLGTIIFPVYSVVSGISMQFGLMAAKKFGVFFSYKLGFYLLLVSILYYDCRIYFSHGYVLIFI